MYPCNDPGRTSNQSWVQRKQRNILSNRKFSTRASFCTTDNVPGSFFLSGLLTIGVRACSGLTPFNGTALAFALAEGGGAGKLSRVADSPLLVVAWEALVDLRFLVLFWVLVTRDGAMVLSSGRLCRESKRRL